MLSRYILDELQRVPPRLNDRLQWSPQDFADLVDILAIEADVPVLGTLFGDDGPGRLTTTIVAG